MKLRTLMKLGDSMKHIQEIRIKKSTSFKLENGVSVQCQGQGTLKLYSKDFPFCGDFTVSFDIGTFEISYINSSNQFSPSEEKHEEYVLEAWSIFNNEEFSDLEVF